MMRHIRTEPSIDHAKEHFPCDIIISPVRQSMTRYDTPYPGIQFIYTEIGVLLHFLTGVWIANIRFYFIWFCILFCIYFLRSFFVLLLAFIFYISYSWDSCKLSYHSHLVETSFWSIRIINFIIMTWLQQQQSQFHQLLIFGSDQSYLEFPYGCTVTGTNDVGVFLD